MLDLKTLEKLLAEQNKLDEFIKSKKISIKDDEGLLSRKKIALLVEIGEFANELKTFKHWKKSKEINWEKAKEELIDCLHFYLSFSNYFHINFIDFFKKKNDEKIIPLDINSPQSTDKYNKFLLGFFTETEKMVGGDKIFDKEGFYRWLSIFEILAKGLEIKNLYEVYMVKNRINWERQKNNY